MIPWNKSKEMGKWDREGKEDTIGYIHEHITPPAEADIPLGALGHYKEGTFEQSHVRGIHPSMLVRHWVRVSPRSVHSSHSRLPCGQRTPLNRKSNLLSRRPLARTRTFSTKGMWVSTPSAAASPKFPTPFPTEFYPYHISPYIYIL